MIDVGVLWLNALTDPVSFWCEGYYRQQLLCVGWEICPQKGRLPWRRAVGLRKFFGMTESIQMHCDSSSKHVDCHRYD